MYTNSYSLSFRKEPATLHEKAKDTLKFLQLPSSTYFDSTRNLLPSQLRMQLLYLHDRKSIPPTQDLNEEEKDTITQTVHLLQSIAPSTYQNRCMIGLSHLCTEQSVSVRNRRDDPVFDSDGNMSLLNIVLFLYTGQPILPNEETKWYIRSKQMSFDDTRDLCVIYDNSVGYTIPHVRGKQIILRAKILYSVLPNNSLYLSEHDQRILWRGVMKKCFLNAFRYDSSQTRPPSPYQYSLEDQEDILKDQCESCLAFVSIDSTCCPYCNDKLVNLPHVTQQRKKGIWMSNWE